jgi:hypothetical protein
MGWVRYTEKHVTFTRDLLAGFLLASEIKYRLRSDLHAVSLFGFHEVFIGLASVILVLIKTLGLMAFASRELCSRGSQIAINCLSDPRVDRSQDFDHLSLHNKSAPRN